MRYPITRMNKKGALELSINAVVILILAITMLGLGLGFIRGLFGGTVEKFEEIGKQLDEEQRASLLESRDQVTFETSRIVVKGRSKTLNFAIFNNRNEPRNFIILENMKCTDAIGSAARDLCASNENCGFVFDTYPSRVIDGTKADIIALDIKASTSAVSSIYSCELALTTEEEGPYVTKRFEIEYQK